MEIFPAVSSLVFLYLLWRNLRENYKEEDLVAFGWVGLGVFFIGSRLWYGLMNWGIWEGTPLEWLYFWKLSGSDFAGGYVALLLLTIVVAQDRGWKLWQFLEDVAQIFLIWYLMILLPLMWQIRTIELAARMGLIAVIFGLGFWVKARYRSWSWYRSGKKGLWFFVANSCYWWGNGIINYFFGEGLNWKVIAGGILGLLSVIGLFILGGGNEKR